jgi:5-methyltetrahydrofolate--homocysteine methyltransferase
MDVLPRIAESLQNGDDQQVAALTRLALDEGIPAKQVLDDGLLSGMSAVGARFKTHEIFLPDVLLAARAMYAGLDLLKPMWVQDEIPSVGTVVIGSVQGDLHDIGKNLVGIMLQGAGFEVLDLGHDVAPETFVGAARSHGAAVIGMSALLTTTMPQMRRVVALIDELRLGGEIKTIVGGAPVSESFAREIGADAYGYDAVSAVDRVKKLLECA